MSSRWDALKPPPPDSNKSKPSSSSSCKNQNHHNRRSNNHNNSNKSNHNNHNKQGKGRTQPRPKHPYLIVPKRADTGESSTTTTTTTSSVAATVEDCLILQRACLQDPSITGSDNNLILLAQTLLKVLEHISASVVATCIVNNLFLPYLCHDPVEERNNNNNNHAESSSVSSSSSSSLPLLSTRILLLQTLQTLVKHSNHGLALLAPLVETVTLEGREELRVNPIRLHVLQMLQQRIIMTANDDEEEEDENQEDELYLVACQTLTVVLQSAYQMEQTRRHAHSQSLDMEPSTIQVVLLRLLSKTTTKTTSSSISQRRRQRLVGLQLLQAYLTRHSVAVAPRLALVLLEPQSALERTTTITTTTSSNQVCIQCGYHYGSILVNCLHDNNDDDDDDDDDDEIETNTNETRSCAYDCLKLLLGNLPWDMWMGCSNNNNNNNGHSRTATLTRNVVRSTLHFQDRVTRILMTVIQVTQCQLLQAGGTLSDYSTSLFGLVHCLLTQIPYPDSTAVLDAAVALVQQLADILLDFSKQCCQHEHVVNVLLEACGGTLTPQGNLTPMGIPLRVWLGTNKGRLFLSKLLSSKDPPFYRLMRAIVRSHPNILAANEDLIRKFKSCVNEAAVSPDSSARVQCVQMIEGLLRGRLDHACSCRPPNQFNVEFVLPLLSDTVRNGAATGQMAACMAYGCLLPTDWEMLVQTSETYTVHFCTMLDVCQSDCGAKVKAEAFKSLGDMCLRFFDPCLSMQTVALTIVWAETGRKIFSVTRSVNAPLVKSMAIFAIGNLAQSLKDRSLPLMIEDEDLNEFVNISMEGLCDPDDRVVANAIRAVGHVVSLLDRYNKYDPLVHDMLSLLGDRVKAAMEITSDSGSKHVLSWKQRSTVKKLAWGACNSLKVMFESNITSNPRFDISVIKSLEQLVSCIKCYGRLHVKVTCCAATALRTFTLYWPTFSLRLNGTDLMGKCIAYCLSALFDSDRITPNDKLIQEMELLCSSLLENGSTEDFATALSFQQDISLRLETFFDWMIKRNCPAKSFQLVSQAIQQSGVQVEVDVEQRFANRAALLQDNENDDDEL